ncbi:MAG: hypothetical protein ABII88_07475 [Candidatus Omnitrophota bacterium]
MSENKRKTIRYPLHAKRLIVLVLIQAFLLLDFAWAGGTDLKIYKTDTLAPAVHINTGSMQQLFNDLDLDQLRTHKKVKAVVVKKPGTAEQRSAVSSEQDSRTASLIRETVLLRLKALYDSFSGTKILLLTPVFAFVGFFAAAYAGGYLGTIILANAVVLSISLVFQIIWLSKKINKPLAVVLFPFLYNLDNKLFDSFVRESYIIQYGKSKMRITLNLLMTSSLALSMGAMAVQFSDLIAQSPALGVLTGFLAMGFLGSAQLIFFFYKDRYSFDGTDNGLIMTGVYRYVRNPMNLLSTVAMLMPLIFFPGIVTAVLFYSVAVFFIIGSMMENIGMWLTFDHKEGELYPQSPKKYELYAVNTPNLSEIIIPFLLKPFTPDGVIRTAANCLIRTLFKKGYGKQAENMVNSLSAEKDIRAFPRRTNALAINAQAAASSIGNRIGKQLQTEIIGEEDGQLVVHVGDGMGTVAGIHKKRKAWFAGKNNKKKKDTRKRTVRSAAANNGVQTTLGMVDSAKALLKDGFNAQVAVTMYKALKAENGKTTAKAIAAREASFKVGSLPQYITGATSISAYQKEKFAAAVARAVLDIKGEKIPEAKKPVPVIIEKTPQQIKMEELTAALCDFAQARADASDAAGLMYLDPAQIDGFVDEKGRIIPEARKVLESCGYASLVEEEQLLEWLIQEDCVETILINHAVNGEPARVSVRFTDENIIRIPQAGIIINAVNFYGNGEFADNVKRFKDEANLPDLAAAVKSGMISVEAAGRPCWILQNKNALTKSLQASSDLNDKTKTVNYVQRHVTAAAKVSRKEAGFKEEPQFIVFSDADINALESRLQARANRSFADTDDGSYFLFVNGHDIVRVHSPSANMIGEERLGVNDHMYCRFLRVPNDPGVYIFTKDIGIIASEDELWPLTVLSGKFLMLRDPAAQISKWQKLYDESYGYLSGAFTAESLERFISRRKEMAAAMTKVYTYIQALLLRQIGNEINEGIIRNRLAALQQAVEHRYQDEGLNEEYFINVDELEEIVELKRKLDDETEKVTGEDINCAAVAVQKALKARSTEHNDVIADNLFEDNGQDKDEVIKEAQAEFDMEQNHPSGAGVVFVGGKLIPANAIHARIYNSWVDLQDAVNQLSPAAQIVETDEAGMSLMDNIIAECANLFDPEQMRSRIEQAKEFAASNGVESVDARFEYFEEVIHNINVLGTLNTNVSFYAGTPIKLHEQIANGLVGSYISRLRNLDDFAQEATQLCRKMASGQHMFAQESKKLQLLVAGKLAQLKADLEKKRKDVQEDSVVTVLTLETMHAFEVLDVMEKLPKAAEEIKSLFDQEKETKENKNNDDKTLYELLDIFADLYTWVMRAKVEQAAARQIAESRWEVVNPKDPVEQWRLVKDGNEQSFMEVMAMKNIGFTMSPVFTSAVAVGIDGDINARGLVPGNIAVPVSGELGIAGSNEKFYHPVKALMTVRNNVGVGLPHWDGLECFDIDGASVLTVCQDMPDGGNGIYTAGLYGRHPRRSSDDYQVIREDLKSRFFELITNSLEEIKEAVTSDCAEYDGTSAKEQEIIAVIKEKFIEVFGNILRDEGFAAADIEKLRQTIKNENRGIYFLKIGKGYSVHYGVFEHFSVFHALALLKDAMIGKTRAVEEISHVRFVDSLGRPVFTNGRFAFGAEARQALAEKDEELLIIIKQQKELLAQAELVIKECEAEFQGMEPLEALVRLAIKHNKIQEAIDKITLPGIRAQAERGYETVWKKYLDLLNIQQGNEPAKNMRIVQAGCMQAINTMLARCQQYEGQYQWAAYALSIAEEFNQKVETVKQTIDDVTQDVEALEALEGDMFEMDELLGYLEKISPANFLSEKKQQLRELLDSTINAVNAQQKQETQEISQDIFAIEEVVDDVEKTKNTDDLGVQLGKLHAVSGRVAAVRSCLARDQLESLIKVIEAKISDQRHKMHEESNQAKTRLEKVLSRISSRLGKLKKIEAVNKKQEQLAQIKTAIRNVPDTKIREDILGVYDELSGKLADKKAELTAVVEESAQAVREEIFAVRTQLGTVNDIADVRSEVIDRLTKHVEALIRTVPSDQEQEKLTAELLQVQEQAGSVAAHLHETVADTSKRVEQAFESLDRSIERISSVKDLQVLRQRCRNIGVEIASIPDQTLRSTYQEELNKRRLQVVKIRTLVQQAEKDAAPIKEQLERIKADIAQIDDAEDIQAMMPTQVLRDRAEQIPVESIKKALLTLHDDVCDFCQSKAKIAVQAQLYGVIEKEFNGCLIRLQNLPAKSLANVDVEGLAPVMEARKLLQGSGLSQESSFYKDAMARLEKIIEEKGQTKKVADEKTRIEQGLTVYLQGRQKELEALRSSPDIFALQDLAESLRKFPPNIWKDFNRTYTDAGGREKPYIDEQGRRHFNGWRTRLIKTTEEMLSGQQKLQWKKAVSAVADSLSSLPEGIRGVDDFFMYFTEQHEYFQSTEDAEEKAVMDLVRQLAMLDEYLYEGAAREIIAEAKLIINPSVPIEVGDDVWVAAIGADVTLILESGLELEIAELTGIKQIEDGMYVALESKEYYIDSQGRTFVVGNDKNHYQVTFIPFSGQWQQNILKKQGKICRILIECFETPFNPISDITPAEKIVTEKPVAEEAVSASFDDAVFQMVSTVAERLAAATSPKQIGKVIKDIRNLPQKIETAQTLSGSTLTAETQELVFGPEGEVAKLLEQAQQKKDDSLNAKKTDKQRKKLFDDIRRGKDVNIPAGNLDSLQDAAGVRRLIMQSI